MRFVEIRCKSFCRPVQPFPPKTTGRKIMQDAQTQATGRATPMSTSLLGQPVGIVEMQLGHQLIKPLNIVGIQADVKL